jgi:type I restriction enzyme, S subunit
MKKGWQTKRLGELCDVLDHKRKPITKRDREAGEYPYYGATGVLDHVAGYLFDEPLVLVGEDGAKWASGENTAFAVEGKIWVNNHAHVLRPHRAVLLDNWLIYHLNHSDLTEFVSGLTVPKLNQGNLREIPIPVPPLAEQQRIVGLLDEAFEGLATAKANAEKNLQNARALFESHLQSVFTQRGPGWVEKKVSEIAKHSLGKMLDKAKNKGEPQPYLRNINVRWFSFDLSDLLEMPFLPNEAEKYTAIKGDVLICEGGYPGRAAIWNEDYPIYFQKALHRVRFHEPEHNKWFVYYLSVQDSSGQLKQHFSGTGIQHFTGEVLARFPIPVPPLPELRRAVEKFDDLHEQTQHLARIYEQKLAALDALKKSLLHQAFAGEL